MTVRLYKTHIEKAGDLLDQAVAAADTPRALTCLYEAVVAITQAITELERPGDRQ